MEVSINVRVPHIDLPEIAFHAVKATLPVESIRRLIEEVDDKNGIIDIQLFNFSGIMYFRPTGQTLAVSEEDEGTPAELDAGEAEESPVLALLDGAPLQQHDFLRNRILLDDIFDLELRCTVNSGHIRFKQPAPVS